MIQSVRPANVTPSSAFWCPTIVLAGAIHGAQAGAAGQHERAVDIEKNEAAGGHGRMVHCGIFAVGLRASAQGCGVLGVAEG